MVTMPVKPLYITHKTWNQLKNFKYKEIKFQD